MLREKISMTCLIIFFVFLCLIIIINYTSLKTTSICDINSAAVDSWVKVVGYVNKITYSRDGKTSILNVKWGDCNTKALMFNIKEINKIDTGFVMIVGKINDDKDYGREIVISRLYNLH